MTQLMTHTNKIPIVMQNKTYYYRPCSEASEGYVFIGVCHSVIFWTTPPPRQHLPLDNTSPWTTPLPWPGSQHPPSPGQHLLRWSGSNVTTPPHPAQGQRSQHLPPGNYAQAGVTYPTGMHSRDTKMKLC